MILKSRNSQNKNFEENETPHLQDLLAKTFPMEINEKKRVMNLYTHCLLVGLTALELSERFPDWLKEKLFPPGFELVCASHDVGKAYPPFQEKIMRSGVSGYKANSFIGLKYADPTTDKANGYHWSVSSATLKDFGRYIPEIVGRHHGVSPDGFAIAIRATDERYGGVSWQRLREELIGKLKEDLRMEWPDIKDNTQASVISGLTSVADWIGSGISGVDAYESDIDSLISVVKEAVTRAGFLLPKIKKSLNFCDVFENYKPYDLQSAFINQINGPGVYSLEEQMGRGKTEAALYAAYSLLEQGKAKGIYFALPTRLTSDRIFSRFNKFLEMILDPQDTHSSALLLHGDSWLQWTQMAEEGMPGSQWFANNRRSILAPFAVGTIDQALMAVMNVRYGFVRTFGLAGKVVILDEIHSYDSYTGRIIDVLVKELRKIGCTIIILSATLTKNRRKKIMGIEKDVDNEEAYPLVIAHSSENFISSATTDKEEVKNIAVKFESDNEYAYEEALRRADEGQQVLWIENTVAEAQDCFRRLSARAVEISVSVGLLHSRFLKSDRSDIENRWVEIFGKEGGENRYLEGRILIGTQVLEQSLDIDADYLVTKVAPTDMLLQRIGRLWRHTKYNSLRPKGTRCEVCIIAPEVEEVMKNPSHSFGPSGYVYPPYILARTLEVWNKRQVIRFPKDIRILLESTYVERIENELQFAKQDLLKKSEKLRGLASIGVASGGKTLPENKATTRYSEQETVDVLLLKSIEQKSDGMHIEFLNNNTILIGGREKKYLEIADRKKIAAYLKHNLVTVAEHQAPGPVNRNEIAWLSPYIYIGTEEYHPFRIAIVCEDGILRWHGLGEVNDEFLLRYFSDTGYIVKKRDN